MDPIGEDGADGETLRHLRDRHVGRLLLRAHRAFSARAVAKLRERGYGGLTLAHIALLPHLDADGTRVTALAERAGMTKQGMGQLVIELERQGYVARAPDPTDRRATLARFTATGRRLLHDAVNVTREMETEYANVLGEQRLEALRKTLGTLIEYDHQRGSPIETDRI
ncbi:MAG: Transcriptional regulator, MarR family [uncultured Thermomicrobiales bacterium]|uniref:Transcriptional regulator, MarR family n=1 Tax=uncultured Thermomicrobiales bacterium TaxID=1645740 RepID=A0A6J4V0R5_9BACT|nr:MAG: Transcriptional regulator, MarR family [uncultured Thermomicrobiales bacterium]